MSAAAPDSPAAPAYESKLPVFVPLEAATLRKRKADYMIAVQGSPRFSDTLKALHRRFEFELELASPLQENVVFQVGRRALKAANDCERREVTIARYQRHMELAFPGVRMTIAGLLDDDDGSLAGYEIHLDWSAHSIRSRQPRDDEDY